MHICVRVPDLMEKPRPRDIAHVGAASGPGRVAGEGAGGAGWAPACPYGREFGVGGGGGSKRPAPATPKLPQPPRRVDKSRLFADGEAGLERGGGLKLGVSEGTGWGLQPGVPRFEAVAMVGAGEAPPGMSG